MEVITNYFLSVCMVILNSNVHNLISCHKDGTSTENMLYNFNTSWKTNLDYLMFCLFVCGKNRQVFMIEKLITYTFIVAYFLHLMILEFPWHMLQDFIF